MISAIVLTPDGRLGDNPAHGREIVARSLVWLVSAVIAGIVRDVTLAASAELGLADLADQSGCRLVEAPHEGERLVAAAAASKQARLIVVRAGYHPDGGLIDEIAALERREPAETVAALHAAPATAWQRLLPGYAPVVGIVCSRHLAGRAGGFAALVRRAKRGRKLETSARPIV